MADRLREDEVEALVEKGVQNYAKPQRQARFPVIRDVPPPVRPQPTAADLKPLSREQALSNIAPSVIGSREVFEPIQEPRQQTVKPRATSTPPTIPEVTKQASVAGVPTVGAPQKPAVVAPTDPESSPFPGYAPVKDTPAQAVGNTAPAPSVQTQKPENTDIDIIRGNFTGTGNYGQGGSFDRSTARLNSAGKYYEGGFIPDPKTLADTAAAVAGAGTAAGAQAEAQLNKLPSKAQMDAQQNRFSAQTAKDLEAMKSEGYGVRAIIDEFGNKVGERVYSKDTGLDVEDPEMAAKKGALQSILQTLPPQERAQIEADLKNGAPIDYVLSQYGG